MTAKLRMGKIISVKRLNNSVNGNPRYEVTAEVQGEGEITLVTKSDAQIGYTIDNKLWRSEHLAMWYHKTRTGNYILDKMA